MHFNRPQIKDKLQQWVDAGANWWIQSVWEANKEQVAAHLRQGSARTV